MKTKMFLLLALSIVVRAREARPQEDLFEEKTSETQTDVAVGIDLGTTFSCVAVFHKNALEPVFVSFEGDKQTYPSTLMYMGVDSGTDLTEITGWSAVENNINKPNSDNYIYAAKRLIGLSDKEKATVDEIRRRVSYDIEIETNKDNPNMSSIYMLVKDSNKNVVKRVSPIYASSSILFGMKKHFEKPTEKVKALIVTTPAYFTENQVAATKTAADVAGLKIDRTLNEPVAAAYAYQYGSNSKENCYVVFDFGGGTLDVSVLEYESELLEVKAYSGDNFLGGENVNEALYEYFYKLMAGKGIKLEAHEKMRLRKLVDDLKIELCNAQNLLDSQNIKEDAKVSSTFLYQKGQRFEIELNTSLFNRLCEKIFKEVEKCVQGHSKGIVERYKERGGRKEDIQKVLLVGGSSRIPWVRQMLARVFGKERIDHSLDPDKAVAKGASYYAAFMANLISDETAIHLVDVLPMSMGICVNENIFHAIIAKDSAVPAEGAQIFTTSVDFQKQVLIQVAQGDRYNFSDCKSLGTFVLTLDKPVLKGEAQIQVTMKVSTDRKVTVTALDKATNKVADIVFERNDYTLSPEVLAQMIKEREENEEKDRERKENDEARLILEEYLYNIEKRMVAPGVPEESRKKVDILVTEVRSWLSREKNTADKFAFKEKFEGLKDSVEPLLVEQKEAPRAEVEQKQPPTGREEL